MQLCLCLVVDYGMDHWMGSLCMVLPSISSPSFVSVTPSMGIVFPILRRDEVSTLVFLLLELFEKLRIPKIQLVCVHF